MFKYYFEQIHGVAVWPIISLSIFFIFFLCLIWWVFSVDRSYVDDMKQIPLDKEAQPKGASDQKITL